MKTFIIFVSSASLSFLVLFPVNLVHADTLITSNITENTSWTKANSPYVISNNPVIASGVALTIEPGVTVKFNNSNLTVFGNIIGAGTAQSQITLTSSSGIQNSTGFLGLNFITPSATSSFSYVSFKNLNTQLFASNAAIDFHNSTFSSGKGIATAGSLVSMSDMTFSSMNDTALALYNMSSGTCVRCTFDGTNAIGQQDAILVYNSSHLTLDHASIIHSGASTAISAYGDFGSGPTSLTMTDSTIDTGAGNGIQAFNSAKINIQNSTISNFASDAVLAYNGVDLSIASSTIEKNTGGLDIFGDLTGSVTSSSIKNNTSYGITSRTNSSFQAENNWWGDASGPLNTLLNATGTANSVSDHVDFIPWLTSEPGSQTKPVCCSSVVFIPGIEASNLYTIDTNSSEKHLWVLPVTTPISSLYLNNNGISIDTGVYTRDIVSSAYNVNVYKNFMIMMDKLVLDKVIRAWEPLPYDWRLDVKDITNGNIALENKKSYQMIAEIERMASSSATGMVTIVSHSNGGLITKSLSQALVNKGEGNLIDKIIMTDSPQLGTPQSVAAALHGDGQQIFFGAVLTARGARGLAINMPAAYNLFPSDKYLSLVSDPVIAFDGSVDRVNNFRKIYGNSITTASVLDDFLLAKDGRSQAGYNDLTNPSVLNQKLLNSANQNHASIDAWNPPKTAEMYQITGWGLPTLSGIKYIGKQDCLFNTFICAAHYALDHQPIITDDGDGTVVVPSAIATLNSKNFFLNLKNYNNKINHGNVFEALSLQMLISNIIQNKTDTPQYVTTTEPQGTHTLKISVHSPVSIDAYDTHGNHTGLSAQQTDNPDLEFIDQNIPGSSYMEFGEGKYVTLDSGDSYTINLKGQDTGTFTLDLSEEMNGKEIASTTFTDIPVSTSTIAKLQFQTVQNASSTIQLNIDEDGNGTMDTVVKPDQNNSSSKLRKIDLLIILLKRFHLNKDLEKFLMSQLQSLQDALKNYDSKKVGALYSLIELEVQKSVGLKFLNEDSLKFIKMFEKLKIN